MPAVFRIAMVAIPLLWLAACAKGPGYGNLGAGETGMPQAAERKALIPTMPFDKREYEPYLRPGAASIKGQAFAKTDQGIIKCSGEQVVLHPATKFSGSANYSVAVSQSPSVDEEGKVILKKVVKRTTADVDGRFTFSALPPGSYYIHCWMKRFGRRPSAPILALTKITLGEGETQEVVVSDSSGSVDDIMLKAHLEMKMIDAMAEIYK